MNARVFNARRRVAPHLLDGRRNQCWIPVRKQRRWGTRIDQRLPRVGRQARGQTAVKTVIGYSLSCSVPEATLSGGQVFSQIELISI